MKGQLPPKLAMRSASRSPSVKRSSNSATASRATGWRCSILSRTRRSRPPSRRESRLQIRTVLRGLAHRHPPPSARRASAVPALDPATMMTQSAFGAHSVAGCGSSLGDRLRRLPRLLVLVQLEGLVGFLEEFVGLVGFVERRLATPRVSRRTSSSTPSPSSRRAGGAAGLLRRARRSRAQARRQRLGVGAGHLGGDRARTRREPT